MHFTDLFIRRPVLASVINILILLIGFKSTYMMQVRQYPEMVNTIITVSTSYPGASADLMQGFVTTPIQRAVASAAGVEYVTSNSSQSLSTVTAHVYLNFSPEVALTEVMAKVQEVISELPKEVQSPIIKKTTGESYAVLYISFSSEQMNNEQITDYINRQIEPRLSTIDGVASLDVIGGQPFAMRIWLDPKKMAARKIFAEEVFSALQKNNYQSAPGQSKGCFVITNVIANTGLQKQEDFEKIIIKTTPTGNVMLKDVAAVELAAQNYNSTVKMNGQQAVFIGVKTNPQANPLTVVKNVCDSLNDFRPNLPPSLKLSFAYDATKFIQESLNEVIKTLLEAVVIVIGVVFLFLGNLRTVLIPIVTIPLSIIGVATILLILGFSINLLTLLAVVLAIGLVVDDAIVVVENICRHMAEGKTPLEASYLGAKEIAGPVIAMTITLVAVYAPIGFMGGITGALFREFALTLAGAVVISGIVALTLSPMMCAKILTSNSLQSNFAIKIENFLHKVSERYQKILDDLLTYPTLVLLTLGIILSLSWFFTLFIPKELAPQEDSGIIMMAAKGPQYANVDYMNCYTDQLIQHLEALPEKDLSFAFAGMGPSSINEGFSGVTLKPWSERKRSSAKIMHELQQKLFTIAGMSVFAFEPAPLPGSEGGLPIQFVINSMVDYKIIYQVMEDLKIAAKKSGLFMIRPSA